MQNKLYNLTNPQKSIWFTNEVFNGTTIANISGTAMIKEKVNFLKLEEAINIFVKQNDGFRLKFILDNGTVKQFVSDFTQFTIDTINISDDISLQNLEKDLSRKAFHCIKFFAF